CTRCPSPFFLGSSASDVVKTRSRVSNSSTCSTSGVTQCTPGYSVQGRAPANWLTSTPENPLGTTVMLWPISSGRMAAAISFGAVLQRVDGGLPAAAGDGSAGDTSDSPNGEPSSRTRRYLRIW